MKSDFYFSRHAKKQMKWRGITQDEAIETISNYDKIENSINNRKNAYKHIGEKYLKVTFTEELNKVIIITAILKENK